MRHHQADERVGAAVRLTELHRSCHTDADAESGRSRQDRDSDSHASPSISDAVVSFSQPAAGRSVKDRTFTPQPCGFAILWKSSASSRMRSSTPTSRATSRSDLPVVEAVFTISEALS